MAVAPDQYGSKRINVRQAPFDSTEKGNIRQARIDEMKEILLTAMESNVKALKFMLEPEEPVSPDIRLSPGKLSISISMNAVDRDVCNTLSSRPLDMKINPEGANIKIPEVRVFDDKLTHIDGDLTIRSLTGKFDGNGRGAKKTWRH